MTKSCDNVVFGGRLGTYKYYDMDENAPAVKGTIKVFRKGNIYKLTWDLQDDAESPNKITGTWEGQLKRLVSVE